MDLDEARNVVHAAVLSDNTTDTPPEKALSVIFDALEELQAQPRVGGPDITPDDTGPHGECPARLGGWMCTWGALHSGPHAAGTGETIVAMWANE